MPYSNPIPAAARTSPLSRAQVQEVLKELQQHDPSLAFEMTWVKTTGDQDQTTSLRTLDKTDFFTKEIDALLLQKKVRLGIHSAKDLPDPLPQGLVMGALTEGVDSSDALVFRSSDSLETLPLHAKVGTSSIRREQTVRTLREDLRCVDIRGTIETRLALLEQGQVDALVVAEAALIRLGLTHLNRCLLPPPTAPLQGKLALICREDDQEMLSLCRLIDSRKKVLYLGTDPRFFISPIPYAQVIHCPLIKIVPRKEALQLPDCTHILLTSKNAVSIFLSQVQAPQDKVWICVGETTATYLKEQGITPHYIASPESQEGIIELLKGLDLHNSHLFIPKSSRSRPLLFDWLSSHSIPYTAVDIYDTHTQIPSPLPSVDTVDLVVFTSPSTVEAFVEIWGRLPPQNQCHSIGPVTGLFLQHMYNELNSIFPCETQAVLNHSIQIP